MYERPIKTKFAGVCKYVEERGTVNVLLSEEGEIWGIYAKLG